MADTSFIQKLRMNNIFPSNGGPQGTPFGMPDMNSGRGDNNIISQIMAARQAERDDERNYLQNQRNIQNGLNMNKNRLPQIGTPMAGQDSFGRNIVFNDPNKTKSTAITPYQQAQLELSEKRLGQSGELGNERLDVTRRGQDISRDRLSETIDVNNERQPNAIELAGIRGDIGSRQIGERAINTADQINQRFGNSQSLQTSGHANALEAIGARTAGQMEVNAAKPDIGMLPTQQRVNIANTARELINNRPDLAPFIELDNNGNPTIMPSGPGAGRFSKPGPTQAQFDEISRTIYPGIQTNINLPPEGGIIPTNKQPIQSTAPPTKPTTQPALAPSKYKVTIK